MNILLQFLCQGEKLYHSFPYLRQGVAIVQGALGLFGIGILSKALDCGEYRAVVLALFELVLARIATRQQEGCCKQNEKVISCHISIVVGWRRPERAADWRNLRKNRAQVNREAAHLLNSSSISRNTFPTYTTSSSWSRG